MAPGKIVHYKIDDNTVRPAIVVSDNIGSLQLQVFLDGRNDVHFNKFSEKELDNGVAWRTSVIQGDGVDQWQWPPDKE